MGGNARENALVINVPSIFVDVATAAAAYGRSWYGFGQAGTD